MLCILRWSFQGGVARIEELHGGIWHYRSRNKGLNILMLADPVSPWVNSHPRQEEVLLEMEGMTLGVLLVVEVGFDLDRAGMKAALVGVALRVVFIGIS